MTERYIRARLDEDPPPKKPRRPMPFFVVMIAGPVAIVAVAVAVRAAGWI